MKNESIFRAVSLFVNVLLISSVLLTLFGLGWEYSTRWYLSGFSNAVLPYSSSPEKKVAAILAWMERGPARETEYYSDDAEDRDPVDTLNYKELLNVCGTATNAFVNLASAGGIEARRLLLLDAPEHEHKPRRRGSSFGRALGDRRSIVPCDLEGQRWPPAHKAGTGPPRGFPGCDAEHRRLRSGLQLRTHRIHSFRAPATCGSFSSNPSEFRSSSPGRNASIGRCSSSGNPMPRSSLDLCCSALPFVCGVLFFGIGRKHSVPSGESVGTINARSGIALFSALPAGKSERNLPAA